MQFFELLRQDKNSAARAGIIHTDHGDVETPCFMPVGTQATVKTLDQQDLENIDAPIILGNTYHLHLRPGEDLINNFGGLHKFMNWDKPLLTDSGGFQVFSLGLQKDEKNKNDNARLVTIDEDGVTFRSHIDGSTHRFTPESAIEIQYKLGADIIMAFDECTPDKIAYQYAKEAMERTHRWAERCLAEHRSLAIPRLGGVGVGSLITNAGQPTPGLEADPAQAGTRPSPHDLPYRQFLFGIIQGAGYKNLREESARFISSLDFDGIAIGGESIGYNMTATVQILDWVNPIIPRDKPHYAMGIGLSPADLLTAVEHGVDMFDCVAPTRLARHGMVFTHQSSPSASPPPKGEDTVSPPLEEGRRGGGQFRLNLNNSIYAGDARPIDENCDCLTCKNYTRGLLHHLFAADEMTGLRLASIHNLRFLIKLMQQAREAIKADRFKELKETWI